MSDDTIQRYEQMLAEDPKSRAFAPLAEAHRKTGRLDEAIKVARAGLEVHPGYSGGLVVLGRALYEKGELDNAVEILQKAVSETPESYLGQKFLGKLLIDKGENSGALRALESANLLSPEDEEVVRLLDEVKKKATSPVTMDYEEKATESAGQAQIVTYEQKPTTVDGIELPPLPAGMGDDKFSFSGGGTADPADITSVAVGEELVSAGAGGSEMIAAEIAGEDMTATVIEEEEVEQAVGIESLNELGPEAAAFILEGEGLVEDSLEDLPDEAFVVAGEVMGEVVMEPEPAPARAPESEPEPAPASAPVPELELEPAPVQAPEPQPQPAAPVQPEPPSRDAAREEQFSTETLADLYAQQGLIEKSAKIYRQILEQAPENETVRLKLNALEAQTPPDTVSVQEIQPPEETQPESSQKDDNEDALNVLEGLLENVERIKRP